MAEDRFHRALRVKIKALVDERAAFMAAGHCVNYEAYKADVAFISALNQVLVMGDDIEREWSR